jgi:predicted adenine nucleotide alpha hydrolase (AANH) superfamily ATPase
MQTNYQKALDDMLTDISDAGKTPRLLLHSCCGPCSSYVLEYLSEYFDISVLFYNPNIWPPEEFEKRAETQRQLVTGMAFKNPVRLVVAEYRPEEFDEAAAGWRRSRRAKRCVKCFRLRREEAAKYLGSTGLIIYDDAVRQPPQGRRSTEYHRKGT